MSNKFNIGEVVILTSSSIPMTVEGYDTDTPSMVKCVWIDKNKSCRESFLEDTLIKFDPVGSWGSV